MALGARRRNQHAFVAQPVDDLPRPGGIGAPLGIDNILPQKQPHRPQLTKGRGRFCQPPQALGKDRADAGAIGHQPLVFNHIQHRHRRRRRHRIAAKRIEIARF